MLSFTVLGANGCKTSTSETDLTQEKAIQCRHRSDHIDWIDYKDSCW